VVELVIVGAVVSLLADVEDLEMVAVPFLWVVHNERRTV
jgi:hypothetical protein